MRPRAARQSLAHAGAACLCRSSAWDSRAVMSAWWTAPDRVRKTTQEGDALAKGVVWTVGRKHFLPPAPLIMGFGYAFVLGDDASVARHVGERVTKAVPGRSGERTSGDETASGDATNGDERTRRRTEANETNGDETNGRRRRRWDRGPDRRRRRRTFVSTGRVPRRRRRFRRRRREGEDGRRRGRFEDGRPRPPRILVRLGDGERRRLASARGASPPRNVAT